MEILPHFHAKESSDERIEESCNEALRRLDLAIAHKDLTGFERILEPKLTINKKWECGRDGGRHRQAGPDHQWEESEYDEHVGDPLEHVIGPGFRFTRRPEAQMIRDGSREPAPREVGRRGKQIFPQVPGAEAGRGVE